MLELIMVAKKIIKNCCLFKVIYYGKKFGFICSLLIWPLCFVYVYSSLWKLNTIFYDVVVVTGSVWMWISCVRLRKKETKQPKSKTFKNIVINAHCLYRMTIERTLKQIQYSTTSSGDWHRTWCQWSTCLCPN